MAFWDDLGLLLVGGGLTLGSSQLTGWVASRRSIKDQNAIASATFSESQRLAAMDQARLALDALDAVAEETKNAIPTQEQGYGYTFDQALVDSFKRSVLLLPNELARTCLEHGIDLLSGWHTLLTHGDDADIDDLPYIQQRRSLNMMRDVLGACVRGDAKLPEKSVAYLQTKGENLDVAWERRIEDDRRMMAEYEASKRAGTTPPTDTSE